MSRAVAAVFVFALGFPVLAMVALAASGAFSPDILSTFLVGGVVVTFVVLALFEIRRLVENESHPAGHSHEVIAAPIKPKVYDAVAAPSPAASETKERTEEIRVSEAPHTVVEVLDDTTSEPIVFEPSPEGEVPVIVIESESVRSDATNAALAVADTVPATPQTKEKGGSRKRVSVASKPSEPKEVVSIVAAKARRKGARSKRPVK